MDTEMDMSVANNGFSRQAYLNHTYTTTYYMYLNLQYT